MIFDFEMLFLGQNFEFMDNQRHRWIGELLARRSVRHRWIGELLARRSVLSNFCRGAKLVKINSIEK